MTDIENLFKISIDKDYYKPNINQIIKIMLNMKAKEIRY